ncbi:mucin-3A-like [Gigantopelta aegis]|uniref:mucin-3A-like n=1 Tax=Gigantopelta aegis TaxID=1735272 RepID=UPI001B88B041|nr:mucin-3A-like [Gigantopelta aegis]
MPAAYAFTVFLFLMFGYFIIIAVESKGSTATPSVGTTATQIETATTPIRTATAPISTTTTQHVTSTIAGSTATPYVDTTTPIATAATPIAIATTATTTTPIGTATTTSKTTTTPIGTAKTPTSTTTVPPATSTTTVHHDNKEDNDAIVISLACVIAVLFIAIGVVIGLFAWYVRRERMRKVTEEREMTYLSSRTSDDEYNTMTVQNSDFSIEPSDTNSARESQTDANFTNFKLTSPGPGVAEKSKDGCLNKRFFP